ncbi:hypothetical protein BFW38_02120 [Terasakiispira papahanaumokuakeensis]|uniref:Cytoplasmic protein n=1 Tax=Terasakiispira papahanaumokuakeensis TaxID=197479 RepID=A0A1E2V683_9GAMM|nr:DUF1249 domain-containing protein [Terasakiispira papahanaumokuakeensis]ODC02520.1 hypothetical protein BFW38_02120 [Terasakiispira papahanaumokuakeensis]
MSVQHNRPNRRAKPYVADLNRLQAECAANYHLLCRLMPEDGEQASWHLHGHGRDMGDVSLKRLERSRYTDVVEVVQGPHWHDWLAPTRMKVRVYHDAQMAEVVAYQSRYAQHGRYEYPNDAMFQPDEKVQLNGFLGEWLKHCMAYGHSQDNPVAGLLSRS